MKNVDCFAVFSKSVKASYLQTFSLKQSLKVCSWALKNSESNHVSLFQPKSKMKGAYFTQAQKKNSEHAALVFCLSFYSKVILWYLCHNEGQR